MNTNNKNTGPYITQRRACILRNEAKKRIKVSLIHSQAKC